MVGAGSPASSSTSSQFRSMSAASRFRACAIEESAIGLEVTLRK
jgi:hypothetical protein